MIQNTSNKHIYTGDGSNRQFEISFKYEKKNNVEQIDLYTCSFKVEDTKTIYIPSTLVKLTTGYTYTTINNVNYVKYPNDESYAQGATPLSTTQVIIILRKTPQEQLTEGPYNSSKVETSLDKLTETIQDLQEQVNRSYKSPVYTSTAGTFDIEGARADLEELVEEAQGYATSAGESAEDAEDSADSASGYALNASNSATSASLSETNAHIWAEGTDAQVQALGGEHSAKNWLPIIKATAPTATVSKTGSTATITITDYNGTTTASVSDGQGVPASGTTGQVLTKNSNTDYDVHWTTIQQQQALEQYTTIPTAQASNVGKIIEYTGQDITNFANGYIYKCISVVDTEAVAESLTITQTDNVLTMGSFTTNLNTFKTAMNPVGTFTYTFSCVGKPNQIELSKFENGFQFLTLTRDSVFDNAQFHVFGWLDGSNNYYFTNTDVPTSDTVFYVGSTDEFGTPTSTNSGWEYISTTTRLSTGRGMWRIGGSEEQIALSDYGIYNASEGVIGNTLSVAYVAPVAEVVHYEWHRINVQPSYRPDLFDHKWADHQLNDIQWLRGDTFSWQDGTVYSAAYNELLSEYNNASSTTETEGSITFKRTPKGYKIASAEEESDILSLYNTTGVAWYYIIDTTNTRFKLPRTKYGFVGYRNTVGDYVTESLPNIKGTAPTDGYTLGTGSAYLTGAMYSVDMSYGGRSSNTYAQSLGLGFDASRSSSTYQDNAPVQQRATQMYLYFYVGNYTQPAIEQTAGLNAELFNGKVDVSSLAEANVVIDTYTNGTSGYRIWSDGYCEQWGIGLTIATSGTITFPKIFGSTPQVIMTGVTSRAASCYDKELYPQNVTTSSFGYTNSFSGGISWGWRALGYLAQGQY